MKLSAYLLLIGAGLATLAMGLDSLSRPLSAAAFLFLGWALTPYVCLAFMVRKVSGKTAQAGVWA